jgi:anion-transporting  ArsA/GET3 family ATPase
MAEFFQAFSPLFGGFRERAAQVEALLRSPRTLFVLVSGPGEDRIPDTLFFARRLQQAGYHLGPIVVNRVHPRAPSAALAHEAAGGPARAAASAAGAPGAAWAAAEAAVPGLAGGIELLAWLGERDRHGIDELARLLSGGQPLAALPLTAGEPTDLAALAALGADLARRLAAGAGDPGAQAGPRPER